MPSAAVVIGALRVKVVVHVLSLANVIKRPINKIQVTIIHSRDILVTVTLECSVKRIIRKTCTGTLANSADADQMPQNGASDQNLHCLLKLQEVKG